MKTLKIGKVAKKIGISSRTLKEWEKLLNIDVPRDEQDHRIYDHEWVEYFNQVKVLYMDEKRSWGEISHLVRAPGSPETEQPVEEVQQQIHHVEHHHQPYREHHTHHHHHQPSGSELVFY